MKKSVFLILVLLAALLSLQCRKKTEQTNLEDRAQTKTVQPTENADITFIELGSVNCIPCRQMQPVMKSIEQKYKHQVRVIFYDVWKDNKPAKQYGIRLIPTQVFLDKTGKEILRHEGFFPEEEIDRFFASQGLVVIE